MKIKDLKIGKCVVVNDLGASKYSSGMRVMGRVIKIDDNYNYAIISSPPDQRYEITDFNDFELWSKQIADKTKSMGLNKQTNDLQQRKRKEKLLQWNDDAKLQFIERVIKDLSPLTAYHIGNAIDVLAVSDSKDDIEQARWSLERAFEVWDQ
ncbi:hypothetical protein [Staphylococcus saprophyticus]|uniref:hypothetical protein n=1 Tax=Staphylococcus saprophyticus TaxID=29385 RepID=UPI0022EAC15A|nr:hypothetical protein [Staphylococcus saprophyticus]